MVLKELILFYSFHFGRCGVLEENSFLTVFTLGGCGGLKRTQF